MRNTINIFERDQRGVVMNNREYKSEKPTKKQDLKPEHSPLLKIN